MVNTAVWLLTKSPIGVAVLIRSRYLAMREATSSKDSARVKDNRPRPNAPASSCDSGLVHDIHSGGCGDCSGLGTIGRGTWSKYLPWCSTTGCVQAFKISSSDSCHMPRVSAGSMPKPPSSAAVADLPLPNSRRPPDSRSSVAACSAARIGWLYGYGSSRTPWPMRMVDVCDAIHDSSTSGAAACENDSRKWCSTDHTEVNPTCSANLICSII